MNTHWRWNLEPKILGIPGYAFLPLLTCIYIKSLTWFLFMVGMVIFYAILGKFGITVSVLIEKLKHRMRGNIIHSRPWWFTKNFRHR